MIHVACSGFPVPVSRYFREFGAVEISDTEIGIPGPGTVRRWNREAPEGFAFAVLAPAAIGESGFALDAEVKGHLGAIADLAASLGARAVVFRAPEGFAFSKPHKAAVKAFAAAAAKAVRHAVFDLPAWTPSQVLQAVGPKKKNVSVAYDPLAQEPPRGASDFVYLRLPGPAGRRSRYDDDAVAAVAAHCEALGEAEVFCVFRNIDMTTNSKALRKKLG